MVVAVKNADTVCPATESLAYGDEVPIPKFLFVLSKKKLLASALSALPFENCTAPGVPADWYSAVVEAEPTQVPLIAKQPLVMATPLDAVVVPPVKVRLFATLRLVEVALVVRRVVMVEDAELKFCMVEDAREMSPPV